MAAGSSNTKNTLYYGIIGGDIVRKVSKDTTGAVGRVNKNNAEVHELHHDYLDGHVVGMKFKTVENVGSFLEINFSDSEGSYLLSIPFSSGYAKSILFRLTEIDYSLPVRIAPYLIEDDGKKKASCGVYQPENSLDDNYTKKVPVSYSRDNPNGLPDLDVTEGLEGNKYDDTKRLLFLRNVVDEVVPGLISKVSGGEPVASPGFVSEEAHTIPTPTEEPPIEEEDDLSY